MEVRALSESGSIRIEFAGERRSLRGAKGRPRTRHLTYPFKKGKETAREMMLVKYVDGVGR